MKHFFLVLIVWIQFGSACAQGLDAPLPLLNHRAYTPLDGSPSTVSAIAQAPDGTLWIGGVGGLSRFDGLRFVSYPSASEDPLPSNEVSSVAAMPDGGIWVGFVRGGASYIRNGRVTYYGDRHGFPLATVVKFALDSNGVLWAASTTGLARLKGERWEADVDTVRFDNSVRGFLIDREGVQWVATSEALFARPQGEPHFREVLRAPFFLSAANALAEAPNGEVWAAAQSQLFSVRGARDNFAHREVSLRGFKGRPLRPIAFDRHGNLWAATEGGLRRVPARALESGKVEEETFLASEGLSHNEVVSILQDREGNVWIGTYNGLDRLSPSNVVRYAQNCSPTAFAAGDAGALWITCRSVGETSESRDGKILSRHDTPMFSAAHRATDGTLWFGAGKVLAHVENGRFVMQPLPAQTGDLPVQALIRDAEGGVWISAFRGLFRLQDGLWSRNGNLDELPERGPLAMEVGLDGDLWLGYRNGRLARVRGQAVQMFDARDGLDVGGIMTIHSRDGEVWIGGERGFALYHGVRFTTIQGMSAVPLRGISGIVRTRNGDLWLNGVAGISHITRENIEAAILDPLHRATLDTFTYLDGVPGTAPQLRPTPSAIEATDGRIWFATTAGLVSIDARRPVRNTMPPPVKIWALTSGDKRHVHTGEAIQLPVHTNRLQIEYSAGSLTVPERVRFRHKLEGLDRDWQDGEGRREAVYANLGPGEYRFRVIAANNDGVWNETGASMAFSIAPAFYQTRWFSALCAFGVLLLLFGLYKFRLRQVSAQIRSRLEARLAERERIARELHDTLLQGMQGLILRFQAATDRIPPDEPARVLMEKSLDRADSLLAESRDKVKDLRPSASDVRTLEEALAIEGTHLAELHPATFRLSVQGAVRPLHPIVQEEGLLLAREALGNAFQHAHALHIEIEVTYGDESLQLRVRDDGQGIGSDMLAAGRPGHFGMIGMRERAHKLGAQLQLWSKPGVGTEAELRVPASVAYPRVEQNPTGLKRWAVALRAIFRPQQRGIKQAGTPP
ncbi:sensor histidine kinase [Variovorax saccharolyticus]|uniref:sensor histidine kinase n=1 Tax=Variovorax saccharolyticus TaxID=3053516 RepID=UPI002575C942|nr:sensor histidine kinase [Variovorax sp. J31P216]MDM0029086.1 two-component regulator propeller domain-containing protein [Variovorax sp. J31P216]